MHFQGFSKFLKKKKKHISTNLSKMNFRCSLTYLGTLLIKSVEPNLEEDVSPTPTWTRKIPPLPCKLGFLLELHHILASSGPATST